MTSAKLTTDQVNQLISDVSAKMRAKQALIAESGGRVKIEVYPNRSNFEIVLTIQTR
jgi:hypothetical protein